MRKIPDRNRKLTFMNQSDVLGNLWSAFNIDLTSNVGVLRASPRMIQTTTSASTSNFGLPVAFKVFNTGSGGSLYAVCGTRVFYSLTYPFTTFTEDVTASAPTDCSAARSDMEVFNSNLYVTGSGSNLYKLTSSNVWSTASSGLTGSVHMMCQYGTNLYITNATSKIASWDGTTLTTTGSNSLDLSARVSNVITFIKTSSNQIWVGTINRYGGHAEIYSWDGSSTQATRSYIIESQGALSCDIISDVPHVMDADGRLLAFNGSNFQEIDRLPTNTMFLTGALDNENNRFIHPNGMTFSNGRLLLFINNQLAISTGTVENCPSGIWEYDKNNGLYPRYSISLYNSGAQIVTDYGQQRISAAGALKEARSTSESSNGRIICGAQFYTDASNTAYGSFVDDTNDTVIKKAYFVTGRVFSDNVSDTWQKVFIRNLQFLTSGDKITVKYRLYKVAPTELTLTAVSTTVFTTTTDVSSYAVGDELEFTQGQGSGQIAHILSTYPGSGTTFIELDEAITGVAVAGTSKGRLQHWVKIPNDVNSLTAKFKELSIGRNAPWVQLKVALTFTGKDEFEEADIFSAPDQNIK